jgi:hypothetical protein
LSITAGESSQGEKEARRVGASELQPSPPALKNHSTREIMNEMVVEAVGY